MGSCLMSLKNLLVGGNSSAQLKVECSRVLCGVGLGLAIACACA